MSNLLDKASILLTPTAYNNGSMLSVKPTDGDGGFTFVRGSAATRVNAQGLVENVQIISSELITNGNFSQIGTEEVTNGNFSNGSTDWTLGNGWSIGEDKAIGSSATGILQQLGILQSNKTYRLTYTILDYVSGSIRPNVGTVNGTLQSSNGTFTEYITSLGTHFYFDGVSAFNGSITNISIKEVGQGWTFGDGWIIDQANSRVDAVDALFNSQLNYSDNVLGNTKYKVSFDVSNYTKGHLIVSIGNVSSDYITANGSFELIIESGNTQPLRLYNLHGGSGTTLSVTNISVKEVTDDTNLPRINYEGFSYDGNGDIIPNSGCGSWLLEPQSTNLITYSEDFSNSYWRKDKLTVTSNSTTSPSGDVNASLIQETSYTSSIPSIDLASTIALSASTHTCSFYVKNNSGRYLGLNFGSGVERIRTNFDFNTETFKTPIFNGTTSGEVSYVKLGDYYRISITATFPSVNNTDINLIPLATDTYPFFQFQDSDNRSFYLWGFQLEEQTHSTSYIPTSAATNTRNQDISTNSGNATLINSTEGVLYAEVSALANENLQRILSISDGTNNNAVQLGFLNSATDYRFFANIRLGGVNQAFLTFNLGAVAPTFKKCAIKYKENDFALWIDGVEVATDTSGSTFTTNTLNVLKFTRGDVAQNFFGKNKALAVYKEALTDAELQSLTTI